MKVYFCVWSGASVVHAWCGVRVCGVHSVVWGVLCA